MKCSIENHLSLRILIDAHDHSEFVGQDSLICKLIKGSVLQVSGKFSVMLMHGPSELFFVVRSNSPLDSENVAPTNQSLFAVMEQYYRFRNNIFWL